MSQFVTTVRSHFDRMEHRPWLDLFKHSVLIAAATVTVLLLVIVAASYSAWSLLGIGRGLVPENFYPVSGFVIVFALTFAHSIMWIIGSAIVFYLMLFFGYGETWKTVRNAMAGGYLALGPLPFLLYHVLYGGWLLGMPREGLGEWLAETHPSARWLLIYAHPIIDLSVIPLAAIFLGILWKYEEQRIQRDSTLHRALAFSLLGTSLAIALSLAIHSILVHARIGL